jgi:hypothetical protein
MARIMGLIFQAVISESDCDCKRHYKQIENIRNFVDTLHNQYDRLEEG